MEVSTLQKAILLTEEIYPKTSQFNVGGYALVVGDLNIKVLLKSINKVLTQAGVLNFANGINSFQPFDKKIKLDTVDFSNDINSDFLCKK